MCALAQYLLILILASTAVDTSASRIGKWNDRSDINLNALYKDMIIEVNIASNVIVNIVTGKISKFHRSFFCILDLDIKMHILLPVKSDSKKKDWVKSLSDIRSRFCKKKMGKRLKDMKMLHLISGT